MGDSNPQHPFFKTGASTNWATAAMWRRRNAATGASGFWTDYLIVPALTI